MTDERLNLPSASALHCDFACPGRRALLAAYDIRETEVDPDAEEGTLFHKAYETGDLSELNDDQREVYNRGLESEKKILAQWCEDRGIEHYKEGPRELRMFLHNERMEPIASGKLDRHYVGQRNGTNHVLVVELKSLWCHNLPKSEVSWQGRMQAVLAALEYDAATVRFVYNKPMLGKVDPCDYFLQEIIATKRLIMDSLKLITPDAPRHAGPHCRYCPAARTGQCVEAAAFSLLPSVIASRVQTNPLEGLNVEEAVERLQPVDLVKLWESSTVIVEILDAAKSRLKRMTPEEREKLGLGLGKGRRLDPITDTPGAIRALRNIDIPMQEIEVCAKLSKEDLAELLKVKLNTSKKGAQEWIKTNLAPYITPKTSDAPLVKL